MIRWGVIGAGGFADKKPIPALKKGKDCKLEALMVRDLERAKKLAEKHGAKKCYDNVDDLLENKDIDAVYIVTPVYLHKDHVIKSAESGKHVLCEKPMALTVAECQEMVDACDSKNVKLGIGYMRIINVHLNWINARARKSQVKTTLQWLEALEERSADLTIFGGDFNAKPNSKPISLVMHNDYFDMKFYNFNDPSLGTSSLNSRIDYIFMAPLNPQLMEVVFERLIWTVDKLSDHVAVLHKYRFYCSSFYQ